MRQLADLVPDLGPELQPWRRRNVRTLSCVGDRVQENHPSFLRTRGSLWLTDGRSIYRLPKACPVPPVGSVKFVDEGPHDRQRLADVVPATRPTVVLDVSPAPFAYGKHKLYAVAEWLTRRGRAQARSMLAHYVDAAHSLGELVYPTAKAFGWYQGSSTAQAVYYADDFAIASVMGNMIHPNEAW